MSVRSFHSVFMATAVAGAALGCYLVSLRVASERAALEQVENQIVQTQREIRLIQTEIGTRARLAQLERWNVRVLALSAPSADQILGDKFQLASLVAPERKPAMTADVVLAAATAPEPQQPLAQAGRTQAMPLLHEAGLKLPSDEEVEAPRKKAEAVAADKPAKPAARTPARPAESPDKAPARSTRSAGAEDKASPEPKKAGEKKAGAQKATLTAPVRTATVDPLAPLPAGASTAKGSRTNR